VPNHPDRTLPELLTITEAAELLRTPVATLRYWRHLGTGPRSFRLGRRVVYRQADIRVWLEALPCDHSEAGPPGPSRPGTTRTPAGQLAASPRLGGRG
jgi:predicted DNA-binding transcriptional regulator AlpA